MPCHEWSDLLRQYRTAVSCYCQAVNKLGPRCSDGFDEVWQQSEIARTRAELFRSSLLNHEHRHGCMIKGGPLQFQPFSAAEESEESALEDQLQSGD